MHEYSLSNKNSNWILCQLRKQDGATISSEVEAEDRKKKSSTKRKRNQTQDLDAPSGKRDKIKTKITFQNQETLYFNICSQPKAIPALVTVEKNTEEKKYMNTK